LISNEPGSVRYEDLQIQLIDTPPVTAEHVPPGFPGLWRSADALVVVAGLPSDSVHGVVDGQQAHLDRVLQDKDIVELRT
jgi:ribosome-interacting GTPase 1